MCQSKLNLIRCPVSERGKVSTALILLCDVQVIWMQLNSVKLVHVPWHSFVLGSLECAVPCLLVEGGFLVIIIAVSWYMYI